MGILKMIFWSLFGPFLIWLALVGHVVYQVAIETPGPIKTAGWPAGTDEAMKSTLIENRKYILKDFKELLSSGESARAKFIANRITDDFEFEDPIEKFVGKEEFKEFLRLCEYITDVQFQTFGEHHSTHEMLLDWSLTFSTNLLPTITIPMRTHFLLEPAEKAGSGEKLFKIFEEWNGNVHLNEKNTFPAILGTVHQLLRRYMGLGVVWISKQGLL